MTIEEESNSIISKMPPMNRIVDDSSASISKLRLRPFTAKALIDAESNPAKAPEYSSSNKNFNIDFDFPIYVIDLDG